MPVAVLTPRRAVREQGVEEPAGIDQRLAHLLGVRVPVSRGVHPPIAVDVRGMVDGERVRTVLEVLAGREAALARQIGQQRVGFGERPLGRFDEELWALAQRAA